jgi:hypothetical protein
LTRRRKKPGREIGAGATGGAVGAVLIAGARSIPDGPLKSVALASIPTVAVAIAGALAYLGWLLEKRAHLQERMTGFKRGQSFAQQRIDDPNTSEHQRAKLRKLLEMAEANLAKELLEY